MSEAPRDHGLFAPRRRDQRVRAWLSPGFPTLGDGTPAGLLAAVFDLEPEGWLRRFPGRETFAWPGRTGWIVKRTSGGEARDFWYERLRGEARSAGRREAENLARMAADGLAVPRPLAWAEDDRANRHPRTLGLGGRSAVVMERIDHTETLRERLERAGDQELRRLGRSLVRFVGRLHALGWYHRDLYLQHFVLADADESLVLLDCGRARKEAAPRRRWLVKDLAALFHSTPDRVPRTERLRFLRAWLAARGELGRPALRRWARAVLEKQRRLAAHRPRAALVERPAPARASGDEGDR